MARKIGADWPRLARSLGIADSDVRQIKRELTSNGGAGQEPLSVLKIWIHLKSTEATASELQQALRRIGRDDIVHKLNKNDLDSEGDSLRLVDSSNLNRSDFSSRGSLGPPERNLSASGGAISEQDSIIVRDGEDTAIIKDSFKSKHGALSEDSTLATASHFENIE